MGAGIAVLFKKKFGGVQELLDQSEWCLKELLISSREGDGAAWVMECGCFKNSLIFLFREEDRGGGSSAEGRAVHLLSGKGWGGPGTPPWS